ncbi:MFS transporter [Brevibacillus centrosporus]|uniref:MFS transporter n=1 Tax=Brevibacillus centrosporus TaxID=54910 RepID=UPI002181EB01|nr:MFS transporter [Brevibacillus centrosporus]MEC2132188.1 MFS transporter [Brevibacillus centrosporus]
MRGLKEGNALWTKEFIILAMSNFMLFVAFQMLIPTLPVFITDKGGDQLAVALVVSLFTVSALLVRPFTGKALDSMGRRPVLLSGLAIFLFSVFGYYWMASVALVLALRFVHGIGWGIVTTTYGTIVSDIIPAERRGEGMGYFGMFTNLAMAVGPLIGLSVSQSFGYGWLFGISGGLTGVAMILTRMAEIKAPIGMTQPFAAAGGGLFEKKALFPALLALLTGVMYGGVVSFITLFGQEVGIENVGLYFLFNAISLMLVRPLAGKLFDKKGPFWVLMPGGVLTGIAVVVLSYSTTELGLIAAAILFGIGAGSVQPSLQAWTIQRVDPSRRGAATGTFFSAFDLGIGGGAMILGAIAKQTGFAMMYRYSLFAMILYLIIYLFYVVRQSKKASTPKAVSS